MVCVHVCLGMSYKNTKDKGVWVYRNTYACLTTCTHFTVYAYFSGNVLILRSKNKQECTAHMRELQPTMKMFFNFLCCFYIKQTVRFMKNIKKKGTAFFYNENYISLFTIIIQCIFCTAFIFIDCVLCMILCDCCFACKSCFILLCFFALKTSIKPLKPNKKEITLLDTKWNQSPTHQNNHWMYYLIMHCFHCHLIVPFEFVNVLLFWFVFLY